MTDGKNPSIPAPHLCELYRLWRGLREDAPLNMGIFTGGGAEDGEQFLPYWLELDVQAAKLLEEWNSPSGAPVPGLTAIMFDRDETKAWIFVFPPHRRGEPVGLERARDEMSARGVTHGVVESALTEALTRPMRLVLLAEGALPAHGRDGYVEYLIDVPEKARFTQVADNEKNRIDYKNLYWLVAVKAGDVLCRLHPPTAAVNGVSVKGAVIPGRPGRTVSAPKGQNTALSESGAELIAVIDGTIRQKRGRLDVENTVTIEGDVDFSTGNLSVEGNIVVKGAVRSGFRVQATGNIEVRQMVEDATLVAGGDIVIEYGMNGNSRGVLRAEGQVRCKFLEHTIVYAKGDVMLGSAINCRIECGGAVLVTTTPGCVIGGVLMSMKKIEARSVGAEYRSIPTKLVIQPLPYHTEEIRRLREEAKAEQAKLDSINAIFQKQGEVSPEKAQIVQSLKEQQAAIKIKLAKTNAALTGLEAKGQEMARGAILIGTAYPGADLTVLNARRRLDDTAYNCRVTNVDGEIHIGLK
ncbi:MAG: FapA family protein [Gracilibacteraceae bacterium]|nr:FapA family protein [Gracilibacteraceae bacterium]